MNEELKRKWIEALRSGEYKQTRGTLHRTAASAAEQEYGSGRCEGYCCLGVLQMVADGKVETNEAGGSMPMLSQEWVEAHDMGDRTRPFGLNLRNSDGDVGVWALAVLNDSGVPFNVIADVIETGEMPEDKDNG